MQWKREQKTARRLASRIAAARQAKDWTRADAVRDRAERLGWAVRVDRDVVNLTPRLYESPTGTRWRHPS